MLQQLVPSQKLYLLRYEGENPGSFAEPLLTILDDKTATLDLDLREEYLKRHAPKTQPASPPLAVTTPEMLAAAQEAICAKLNERTAHSQSVTSILQKDAEAIFKDNADGQARGKELGSLTHSLMEWICRKAGNLSHLNTAKVALRLRRSDKIPNGMGRTGGDLAPKKWTAFCGSCG